MQQYYVRLHITGSGSIVVEGESETAVRAMVELALKREDTLNLGPLEFEEIEIQSIVEVPAAERVS